ncbi:MAG TPA: zinc ribbon domain-containing protein [Pyrinomonadaceae bacterium]|nr:zinc ribbon domain-containing protein [Pyrinomonadaceae bacterium]
MFCPRCGASQSDELRFCKACGANLSAVRQVVNAREPENKLEANTPWWEEMVLSDADSKRRKEELDHERGIAPEVRRYTEIKAGVIVCSIGVAIAIFLAIFMQGLILSGSVSTNTAEILSRLWVAGVLPLFVGLALIVNGAFVSKRLAELAGQAALKGLGAVEKETNPLALNAGDAGEFIPARFSVTEQTTHHLSGPARKQ